MVGKTILLIVESAGCESLETATALAWCYDHAISSVCNQGLKSRRVAAQRGIKRLTELDDDIFFEVLHGVGAIAECLTDSLQ